MRISLDVVWLKDLSCVYGSAQDTLWSNKEKIILCRTQFFLMIIMGVLTFFLMITKSVQAIL